MGGIRKLGPVLLVLGVCLFAASCGKDGKIYGAVDWDYFLYNASIGGFPSSGYAGVYYEIKPGSYNVYYTLQDGPVYYPGSQAGHPDDPSYYWIATYTVEVDKGKFPMINGKDRTFYLYLGYDGMYKYGDVKAIRPLARRLENPTSNLGTQTWSENGLRFTITNKVGKLTSDEVSKLGKSSFAK